MERLVDRHGLLLMHDAKLPSATACIAGEAIRGSWWGHAKGKLIFETLTRMAETVAWAKLIAGKETLVHRRLWPALIAVAGSNGDWQLRNMRADAKRLLQKVRRGDAVPTAKGKLGSIATDLERRLLVRSFTEHTAAGHHVRFLETWTAWGRARGIRAADLPDTGAAIATLSSPGPAWGGGRGLVGLLPWARGG